ncbi:sensor histidine kinase [Hymenobacter profundi]|uniref:histidine kinase n=1 Tax=Hymenobacter profundi TaxID=1982110 RepID=A0ABS6X1J7_9BACT|nr:sensor histidine kinase [Hymenobacter profundi]MBW3128864.1 ATP-binding protein [Hymenobacter profundi]
MGGKLKWRFDVSTFKLLGRGLITDRITAIYELVKNCYDANSTKVELQFSNVSSRSSKSRIVIRDNGLGMTLNDIKDKWLVVGTASKRKDKLSPSPFKRRYIGEKGVGRFATDKLGQHLCIKTKKKSDKKILKVTINWKEYERISLQQQVMFTDLENEYEYIENDDTFEDEQGTELIITMLHEAWDTEMLLRLYNQLKRIIPPVHKLNPPFDIFITASNAGLKDKKIIAEPIESMATIHANIPFDYNEQKQGYLYFNEISQDFEIRYRDIESFGPINLDLYFFNQEDQRAFKAKYKDTENYIEGAKIYRDGVICTPFAEYETVLDKRRDILGIDKRRWQDAFNRLSTREFIGIINITKDRNPQIIDATNRQDFVDNEAYRRLKEFIIEQLDVFVNYKVKKRSENKIRVQNNLKRASADVKDISTNLAQIVRARPELKEVLAPTIAKARQVTDIVKEGVKDQQETEQEFLRKEALYLSLMSLQDFAGELAHGIRFALTPIKHASEFFIDTFPNPNYNTLYTKYSKVIFDQSEKISSLIDFMLSYAQVDVEDTTFSIKDLITSVLSEAYALKFEQENIHVDINISSNIQLTGKKKLLEDVLTNLSSNSIKALKKTSDKHILCESYVDSKSVYILFSDNGHGVNDKIKNSMFDMFSTTTAEEGGAGLGLFIAKTRMSALNGSIELTNSVYSPIGATFKLTLPLKK